MEQVHMIGIDLVRIPMKAATDSNPKQPLIPI